MNAIRIGICALLAFAVVALGGVQPWGIASLEIGAAGLFLLWGAASFRRREANVRWNWIYLPVIGLIAVGFAQKVLGVPVYPYASQVELLKWVAYLGFSFLAVETFRSAAQLRRLAWFLAGLGFLVALFAIVQHYSFNGKLYWFIPLPPAAEPFGPFVNRDHFAGFVELTAPMGLAMLLDDGRRGEKAALLTLFTVVPIAALVLSGSRGGIVAFALAALGLVLLSRLQNSGMRQLLAFTSLVIVASGFIFWLGAGGTIQRFETLTPSGLSRGQRVALDRDTWRIFSDHPWIGTGLGTLETVFPRYETDYDGLVVDHAHNDYLELLAETGVIGGFLGLVFIVVLFRRGFGNLNSRERRASRAFYAGSLAGCGALLVHSFVDFNLHIPANALLFLLLASMATADTNKPAAVRNSILVAGS